MTYGVMTFASSVAFTYVILLGVYFLACTAVPWLARITNAKKLQSEIEPQSQIKRDRKQSIVSLLGISFLFGAGQWLHEVCGFGIRPGTGVVWSAVSFLVSLIVFDTWFYWMHRLIHHRRLYRTVHRWHHLTTAPGVWSNNSDLLLDNLFLQSYWLVAHFIIPVSPLVLLLHKVYDEITGIMGHSGYELGGIIAYPPSPIISVTHHDQHHRYFHCNYATHFSIWDRLMGTLHPTHDSELKTNIRGGDAREPTRAQALDLDQRFSK